MGASRGNAGFARLDARSARFLPNADPKRRNIHTLSSLKDIDSLTLDYDSSFFPTELEVPQSTILKSEATAAV